MHGTDYALSNESPKRASWADSQKESIEDAGNFHAYSKKESSYDSHLNEEETTKSSSFMKRDTKNRKAYLEDGVKVKKNQSATNESPVSVEAGSSDEPSMSSVKTKQFSTEEVNTLRMKISTGKFSSNSF